MDEEQPVTQPPRLRRGAQRGNQNALKHGLYVRRRRPPPPEPVQEVSLSQPTRQRLSLVSEIDYLRVQFRRLYPSSVHCSKPDEIAALVRNLSLGAVAITRLIMTEDYLAQAVGNQVQYDQLDQTIQKFIERQEKANPPKPPPKPTAPAIPITDPELEAMNPGIHLLAFQCGMTIEQIARTFYPDILKRRRAEAALLAKGEQEKDPSTPKLPQGSK